MNADIRNLEITTAPENTAGDIHGNDVSFYYEVAPNDYTSDTIGVIVGLQDTGAGEEGEKPFYDVSFHVGNGDWASPREMQAMLGAAIDHFYENRVWAPFGSIIGERA